MSKCQCLTDKGTHCTRTVKSGEKYCFQHKSIMKSKKQRKFSLLDIDNAIEKVRQDKNSVCEFAMWDVLDILTGVEEYDQYNLINEYEKLKKSDISLQRFIVTRIEEELKYSSWCIVMINEDNFSHAFVLILVNDRIFRIEAYIHRYCTRLVEWPTYKEDLIKLCSLGINKELLYYWNGLFSADEKEINLPKMMEITIGCEKRQI